MVEPHVPDSGGGDGSKGGESGESSDGGRGGEGSAVGGGGDDDGVPDGVALPCGERAGLAEFDLGMREYACACGERHAVVLDVHPPSRFVPEAVVDVLRESVTPSDEDAYEEFGTPHLLGVAMEEFPDDVVAVDASGDGAVGYGLLWVTTFDARTLHEHLVELVVELMEHAVSHAEDDGSMSEFEAAMLEFDVEAFVEEYRRERDFSGPRDRPA